MRCRNSTEAYEQAQANADRSGVPWKVFVDTSGNWRAERDDGATSWSGVSYVMITPRAWSRQVESDVCNHKENP